MARRNGIAGQARLKTSPTDQHARKIATALAKGRQPALTPDLESYFDDSPREIFAAFEGAARHMPPAGKDEALAFGYLFVLHGLLEHLRYRTDRGYADAMALISDFQAAVAARAEARDIDGLMLALTARALQQAKIPVSAELSAAAEKQIADHETSGPGPADMGAAIVGMLDACGGDPFALIGAFAELSHAMPGDTRGALASSLALSGMPSARSAAVLLALDSEPEVRRSAVEALGQVAASLSPIDVRRLIAMRNWRPESERPGIDAVIRQARAAGIDCAQWEEGRAETILASAIDGSASQGFLLVSPASRKKRLSSILTKDGIADAWSSEAETRRRTEAVLADADTPMVAVPRSYLDREMAHHLALSTEKGKAAPSGLLQVAETIGGADWQPTRMDFGEALARMMAEIPATMRAPAFVREVLRNSDQLADLELIAQSWFEDDREVARIVADGRNARQEKLATYLLQGVIARRREKWADLFLRTALWLRDVSPEGELCWRELVIVAQAVVGGRDLSEIGLMRDIALRTIAALGATVHR